MTTTNDNTFCNPETLSFTLTSTIFTPSLTAMLEMTARKFEQKVQNHTKDILKRIGVESRQARRTASSETGLSPASLLTASSLFSLVDDVIVSASVQEKIKIFDLILSMVDRQEQNLAPCKLTITDCPRCCTDQYTDLSSDQIRQELLDYSDDIETWLDLHLDYDDFDATDTRYDGLVQIMTDLRALAYLIEHE